MGKNQNSSVDSTYQKFSDYTLKVLSREANATRRAFGAKVVILPEDSETWITENKPKGPSSKEVGRSIHSRIVRRLDGRYTLTFRFDADEKQLREQLLAEMRNMATVAIEDRQSRKEVKNA